MSRVSILQQLTTEKKKTALEFDYDSLWAPPIMSLFTPSDLQELRRIATSVRYNGNIAKKYDLIDAVMKSRGFRRAACGTNRVVYNFLEDQRFVAKVAVDKVGMGDSPAEYKNQAYFQPFCCKIFEVDPSGVIAFIERVNPISSIEEFVSVKDDVFNMMITKIIGKYIVDDLGTKAFMNFGIRMNANGTAFGPVIIDFPYAYELDGAKLKCAHKIPNKFGRLEECGGDIDYGPGFNKLYCNRCHREYRAIDLAKEDNTEVKFEYTDEDKAFAKRIKYMIRARIIDNGKVIIDTGRSSNRIISKEEFEMSNIDLPVGVTPVSATIRNKKSTIKENRQRYYTELQMQYYSQLANAGIVNPVIKIDPAEMDASEVRSTRDIGYYMESPVDNSAYSNYLAPESPIVTNVWGTVNPDMSTQIYAEVDVLEKATFPELVRVEDTDTAEEHESAPIADSGNETHEEDHSLHQEYSLPKQIVPDEVVQEMVNAVKANNGDAESKEMVSAIVDPEADKIPERSPITRPYADPKNSVLYTEPKDTVQSIPLGPVNASSDTTEDEEESEGSEDLFDAIAGAITEAAHTDYRLDDSEEYSGDESDETEGEYAQYLKQYGKEDRHNSRKKLHKKSRFNDSSNLDEY